MRGMVIVAIGAVLLAWCWLAFIHSGNPPPRQGEQAAPGGTLSARHETRTRTRASDQILSASLSASATNELVSSNLYARLRDGSIPRVTREQLEPYLAQNRRNVEALLGALRASGDDALLAEA